MNKREIKFRVWDKLKKIFLPDDVYSIINRTSFNAFGQMITDWEDYKEGEYFYDNAQELVLFTGLKDKNGVEIYEGDILRYPNPKCFGVVEFGLYEGGEMDDYISGNGFYLKREDSKPSNFGKKESSIHLEIIGNIYEHPHLLTPIP